MGKRGVLAASAAAAVILAGCGTSLAGSYDASYSGDGVATASFGASAHAVAVAVQPDGKVVAAGQVSTAGGDVAVARFLTNGALDTSFGAAHTGKVTVDSHPGFNAYDLAWDVVLQDGRIVVAGQAGDHDVAVWRFTAGGLVDTSFGYYGTGRLDVGVDFAPSAVRIQSCGGGFVLDLEDRFAYLDGNGRYVDDGPVGLGATTPEVGCGMFAAVTFPSTRLESDNQDFGDDGTVILDGFELRRFVVTPAGRVLVYGFDVTANGSPPRLVSLAPDGQVEWNVALPTVEPAGGPPLVWSAGPRVDSAGRTVLGTQDGRVVRFTSGGLLDSSFDGDGFAPAPFLGYGVASLAVAPGVVVTVGGPQFTTARLVA